MSGEDAGEATDALRPSLRHGCQIDRVTPRNCARRTARITLEFNGLIVIKALASTVGTAVAN